MTHPRDVWVDITVFGEAVPRFMLAVDGREVEIAEARELFALDRITIEEFERIVDRALA